MTDLFLSCRITLRTRTISIYANPETSGKIDSVFDRATAILGIPAELPLPEETSEQENTTLVSRLSDIICYGSYSWGAPPSWVAIEQSLLSFALPHCRFVSTGIIESHPILRSAEHRKWVASRGLQVLYVHGKDQKLVAEAAEQVFLAWQRQQHDMKLDGANVLSFAFSNCDPERSSMSAMASALIVETTHRLPMGEVGIQRQLLENQFSLQHGWTAKDVRNLLRCNMRLLTNTNTAMLFLRDLDACGTSNSRMGYLKAIAQGISFTDAPIKLLITSTTPDVLTKELDICVPNMTLHSYRVGQEPSDNAPTKDSNQRLTLRFCPNGHGETFFQERLQELIPMNRDTLCAIVETVSCYTGWPNRRSSQTHARFCELLGSVTVSDTVESVLDNILRSIPDTEQLRSTLIWVLCGSRPLTPRELTALCFYSIEGGHVQLTTHHPSSADLLQLASWHQTWLTGLLEFSHGQVCLRQDVLRVFQSGGEYIWAEIQSTAPETTCTFLNRFLTSKIIQSRLTDIYRKYQERVISSKKQITPPVIPDRRDIIYYATESFPYHLSKAPSVLKTLLPVLFQPNGPLTPWAHLYWAMQNPFSRPKMGDLDSAGATLLALGDHSSRLYKLLSETGHDLPTQVGSLSEAMRRGDEDAVLHNLDRSPGPENISVLWRAVYLDMRRVVDALLDAGMSPDPSYDPAIFDPSPLYMACKLNHLEIVQSLLKKGANINVLRSDTFGILYIATVHGNDDVIKAIVSRDNGLLDAPRPWTPLYVASCSGLWKVVETLASLDANMDLPGRGHEGAEVRPLAAAVSLGRFKTVQALLENDADPNPIGPGGRITALEVAIQELSHPDCIRLLLDHNANPNHELHDPTLLVRAIVSGMQLSIRLEIMDILVSHESAAVDINAVGRPSSGMTPLMHAAAAGDRETVDWLLDHQANIALVDLNGQNALFHAVGGHHVGAVQVLLGRGSPLAEKNNDGWTMLELALQDAQILELLLNAGVDPEVEMGGLTAINRASSAGNVEAVRLLVKRGVNIHHRDSFGWSPILDASGYSPNEEICRILMEAGAKLTDTTIFSRCCSNIVGCSGWRRRMPIRTPRSRLRFGAINPIASHCFFGPALTSTPSPTRDGRRSSAQWP
ncbi:hypothetical protein ASPZODRAFT_910635 [Penicilliopsis zonata CBS 506.65]|uniref:Uncharacterized protein n=1 Tax=Penicilliopsis zonata CBS 506.65 TaxID=1073090 RepID=A0A1L9S936_9EURO|nr:hypothetical protein ASPZODRAFT_910635 [Penicilliopsis zonata CBS 506.65]OJJ43665.1 hypothetical protein ASPZODRAFT_910635 [Penicilliopsis zonata CBS 506.65]